MTIITPNHKKWATYESLPNCAVVKISGDFQTIALKCCKNPCVWMSTRMDELIAHMQKKHAHDIVNEKNNKPAGVEEETMQLNLEQELPLKLELEADTYEFKLEDVLDACPVDVEEPLLLTNPIDEMCAVVEENSTDIKPVEIEQIFFNDVDHHDAEHKAAVALRKQSKPADRKKKTAQVEKSKSARKKAKIKHEYEDDCEPKISDNVASEHATEVFEATEASSDVGRSYNENEQLQLNESDSDNELSANEDDEYLPSDMDDDEVKPINRKIPKSDVSQTTKYNVFAMENRSLMSLILDCYANNAVLWDINHDRHRKHHDKREVLEKLCSAIKTQLHIELKHTQVRNIFHNLQQCYYRELEKCKAFENRKPDIDKLWYWPKIQFLPETEVKLRKKGDITSLLANAEAMNELLQKYKEFDVLWDGNHPDNWHKKQRDAALLEMFKQLQQANCSLSFVQMKAIITRMRSMYKAEKSKRLQCEQANEEFLPLNAQLYEKLFFLDSQIGPFRCTFEGCTEIIHETFRFKSHMAAHEGRKAFQCTYCDKSFNSLMGMEGHVSRDHTNESRFECAHCDKVFYAASDLRCHKNSHIEEMRYVCDLCGKTFHTKSYLNRHTRRHKNELQCPLCPNRYSENYRFQAHLNSHAKVRSHICDICGKGFYSQHTLGQHKKLHTDVWNYLCNLCGKRFKQVAALHSHRKWTHKTLTNADSCIQ